MKLKLNNILLLIMSVSILSACNSGGSTNTTNATVNTTNFQDASATPLATQYIYQDTYNCKALPVCDSNSTDYLSCVSSQSLANCNSLQGLSQSGVTLNDSRNYYISTFQNQNFNLPGNELTFPTWESYSNATTLFPAYTITYNPDPSTPAGMIGLPIRDQAIESYAFGQSNLAQCSYYMDNNIQSYSPWVSHCSAFAEWAESSVFQEDIPPAPQEVNGSYDWCGLADKNASGLQNGDNNWRNVNTTQDYITYQNSAVTAQVLANQGCSVVANYYNAQGAGHIGIILPNTWQQSRTMQLATSTDTSQDYPTNISVTNSATFQAFITSNGPEEMQAGLYDFAHTTTFNGFYSELNPPMSGTSDAAIESAFSNVMYYYNTQTCSEN